MNGKKAMLLTTLALLVCAGIFALLWQRLRTPAAEGALQLLQEGQTEELPFALLDAGEVKGTLVRSKGNEEILARGISVKDLLKDRSYSFIEAVSDDAYTARIPAEDAARAYIILEDGKPRLIVFGDTDAKRSVKGLIRLELH